MVDGGDRPGQSKVCEFGEAVRVEQDIGGFEVAMDEFSGVHVLDGLEDSEWIGGYW